MTVETFIHFTEGLIIVYFLALNTIYLAFTAMAFVDLIAYRRKVWRGALERTRSDAASSRHNRMPSVSTSAMIFATTSGPSAPTSS